MLFLCFFTTKGLEERTFIVTNNPHWDLLFAIVYLPDGCIKQPASYLHVPLVNQPMWINYILLSGAFIEIYISLWAVIQADNLHVYCIGYFDLVI